MSLRAPVSRRDFLASTALAGLAMAGGSAAPLAQAAPERRFKIVGFSKPFQNLNLEETAAFVAEVGWDGIECPVRTKGQIEPERAPDDLPRLAEALKKHDKEISLITTNIHNPSSPNAEKVLRTAAKLGIKRYRLGEWRYIQNKPVADQLKEIHAELRDMAALNKELGLQAGFQNHSSPPPYVGAAIWDIWELIRDLDPAHMGFYFDIGHAMVGGSYYSWPIEEHAPNYTVVAVKDFVWQHTDKGWSALWVKLGEGVLDKSFFQSLKKSSYSGPISLHTEYDHGKGADMIANMQKDLRVLKEWLAA